MPRAQGQLQWRRMRFASRFVIPLLAVVAMSPLSAQQSPAVTTMDVVVTSADGRAVADLQAKDLVIRLNGRPQTITNIRLVRPVTGAVREGLPLPYATNTGAAGRTTAVLIDVARLSKARAADLQSGLRDLTGALTPSDRLALIPLAGDVRPVDFTTSHARVVEAAGALPLGNGPARDRGDDEDAVEAVLGALGRAAVLLGSEPDVKTLVVVTEPFVVTGRLRQSIQALGELAARNRIALYVAMAQTATVAPGNGVHALAAGTGGVVVPLGAWASIATLEHGRLEVSLARDEDLDEGATARALVATVREGVTVRSTPFVYVPAGVVTGLDSLKDMLRQSRAYTDLPLRLGAYPVLHTDRSSIRLLIVGDTVEPDRALAWSEFGLFTPDGRMSAQWSESRDALAQRPFISGVIATEGQYRLRWAASELSGRRGTVDIDVDARFTAAGPFRLSALMLGRLTSETFVPVLQPADDATTVEWYAEIYGDLAAGQTLTSRLDVTTSLTGQPLSSTEGRVLTSPDPSRRAMTGGVDVSALPAGDYLFRATLVVNGTDTGTVVRTFRKVR